MKYIVTIFFLLTFNNCFVHYVTLEENYSSPPLEEKDREKLKVQIDANIINESIYKDNMKKADEEFLSTIMNKVIRNSNLENDANADYKLKFLYRVPKEGSSLSGLLWVFSLGIIPAVTRTDRALDLEVFYKGELLKKYKYGYRDVEYTGWLCIPVSIFISPFVEKMSNSIYLKTRYIVDLLQPAFDRIAYDTANNFNIDSELIITNKTGDTKTNALRQVEIFKGSVSAVSGNQVTINSKQKIGLRPGLLVFYQDDTGKIVSIGHINEINSGSAKATFTGTTPTKGLEVVAYKEVFDPSKK